jgi:TonB-dependent starch-binding outer membrane protein SusC
MKNIDEQGIRFFDRNKNALKILMVMKLSTFFLLISILSVTARGYSQQTRLDVSLNNATMQELFLEIENQSEFNFFYKDDQINVDRRISVEAKNSSIEDVLKSAFKDTGVSFTVVDKVIVITPKAELQNIQITGTLTSASTGETLPGVNILVKGTGVGTISGIDGEYTIEVPDANSVLVFSYIGYTSQEISVSGESVINIVLEESTEFLEELVVVGYGTVKKSDITGSVASVSSDDLTAYPAGDAIQALQGMAAGVQVQSTNGEPGSGYSISIRGNTSINASSDPLIVVDGFPGAEMPPPEDIESMEVLKDASSTAIYGSRGANGVVLVTTKSGKSGVFKVDFSASSSFQQEINRMEVLNATDYATLINEIDPGFYNEPSSYGVGTDWQDEIYRKGLLQNYQLSVSGGTDEITYYLSGTYYDQQGVVINSDYQRYSFTSNVKAQVLDWLSVGANIHARSVNRDGVRSQTGGYYAPSVPDLAYKFSPTVGVYDEGGNLTVTDRGIPYDNPYGHATEYEMNEVTDLKQGNFFAELDLLKGLTFKTTLGLSSASGRDGRYITSKTERGSSVDGEANLSYDLSTNMASENYFTYSTVFNDVHNMTVMAGYSYQSFNSEGMGIEYASGFPTDAFLYWNLGSATGIPVFDSQITKSKLGSYYGRLNYGFNSKYLLTFNARYDGSSRFAENNKWAFFPSGALAWNIKKEGFMSNVDDISQLKLRVSYGLTGNQAIRPYQSLASLTDVFTTDRGSIVSAIKPGSTSNPNLTWESTAQMDIGLDIGLLENRIGMTADYYKMITSDLLFSVPVARFSGFSYQLQNIGQVQNSGVEFALNAKILTGKLKWSTNANISLNRNKILTLVENENEFNDIYYGSPPIEGGGSQNTQLLREGESVGVFYGYVFEGVVQEDDTQLVNGDGVGGEKFKDINSDGILDDMDRVIVGNPHPDFIWSWNNSFTYGGFDLNIFIQGSQGGDMINYTRMELGTMNGRNNVTVDALDRWTPTNTDTDIPMASISNSPVFSDRWVEEGSYIRLKNISLGYNINESLLSKTKVRSARIYVSAQNILTFTKYKGVDPEISYGSGSSSLGLDYAGYPSVKSLTVGVNVGF